MSGILIKEGNQMDALKLAMHSLIDKIKNDLALSANDRKRIVEKILWIEKEIRIYRVYDPSLINDEDIPAQLKRIFK